MSGITDRSKNPDLRDGFPGAIKHQEAVGQKELVGSTLLPTKINGPEGDRLKLEAMGIRLGEPLADDSLFCQAELPPGWKKQSTDHSMWSNVIDETGKVRVSVFYKASFYDRDAFMSVKR